jgi:hypothetical protein
MILARAVQMQKVSAGKKFALLYDDASKTNFRVKERRCKEEEGL